MVIGAALPRESALRDLVEFKAAVTGQLGWAARGDVFVPGDSTAGRAVVDATAAPAPADALLGTTVGLPAGSGVFRSMIALAGTGEGATDQAPAVVLLLLLAAPVNAAAVGFFFTVGAGARDQPPA